MGWPGFHASPRVGKQHDSNTITKEKIHAIPMFTMEAGEMEGVGGPRRNTPCPALHYQLHYTTLYYTTHYHLHYTITAAETNIHARPKRKAGEVSL